MRNRFLYGACAVFLVTTFSQHAMGNTHGAEEPAPSSHHSSLAATSHHPVAEERAETKHVESKQLVSTKVENFGHASNAVSLASPKHQLTTIAYNYAYITGGYGSGYLGANYGYGLFPAWGSTTNPYSYYGGYNPYSYLGTYGTGLGLGSYGGAYSPYTYNPYSSYGSFYSPYSYSPYAYNPYSSYSPYTYSGSYNPYSSYNPYGNYGSYTPYSAYNPYAYASTYSPYSSYGGTSPLILRNQI